MGMPTTKNKLKLCLSVKSNISPYSIWHSSDCIDLKGSIVALERMFLLLCYLDKERLEVPRHGKCWAFTASLLAYWILIKPSEDVFAGSVKISYITMMITDAHRVPYRSWGKRCGIKNLSDRTPAQWRDRCLHRCSQWPIFSQRFLLLGDNKGQWPHLMRHRLKKIPSKEADYIANYTQELYISPQRFQGWKTSPDQHLPSVHIHSSMVIEPSSMYGSFRPVLYPLYMQSMESSGISQWSPAR